MLTPQLKPDEAIFVQTPHPGGDRILHAGRVVETDPERGYLARFEGGELPVRAGEDVLLFYEWNRRFTQQPAHVVEAAQGTDGLQLGLHMAGDPISAESRECFRVSAIAANLKVSLDRGDPCEILDVSATGFSIFARAEDYTLGALLDARLHHEGCTIPGQVRVQNARKAPSGRLRYGLQCVDDPYGNSLLLRALPRINLAIQREQLARRAGLTAQTPPARFVPGGRFRS